MSAFLVKCVLDTLFFMFVLGVMIFFVLVREDKKRLCGYGEIIWSDVFGRIVLCGDKMFFLRNRRKIGTHIAIRERDEVGKEIKIFLPQIVEKELEKKNLYLWLYPQKAERLAKEEYLVDQFISTQRENAESITIVRFTSKSTMLATDSNGEPVILNIPNNAEFAAGQSVKVDKLVFPAVLRVTEKA